MIELKENVQVRVKNDPSVAGITTGKKREKSAGRFAYEVDVIGKGKRYFLILFSNKNKKNQESKYITNGILFPDIRTAKLINKNSEIRKK